MNSELRKEIGITIPNDWKLAKLGDFAEFKNGVNFPSVSMGKGVKIINVKDIFSNFIIDFGDLDRVDLATRKKIEDYFIKDGDILFVRSSVKYSGIGLVSLVREIQEPSLYCGFIIRCRIEENTINKIFLAYLLRSPLYREIMKGRSTGAAVVNITQNSLASLPIIFPPLPTQQKIASILSAYDDLIEINERRIKILEEMARVIYKEWFVKFRFPGHKKVKIVESELGMIPGGWEASNLKVVLEEIESGSRPKGGVGDLLEGIPSIGAENILGLGKYDFSKTKYVSKEFFESMQAGVVRNSDVLLYKDGAQIGRKSFFDEDFPFKRCCVNEHVFILRANKRISQKYLFFWVEQPWVTQEIINLNANAAQPGINRVSVKTLPILVPDSKLIKKFDEIVGPLIKMLFTCCKENQILRQTRDLLLPKLISGKIDVSGLDVQTGE